MLRGGFGDARFVLVRPRQGDVGLAFAQCIENESDMVEVAVERLEQLNRSGDGRLVDVEARLHQVHELAQAHRARHPRAALERVQRSPQLAGTGEVARRAAPCAHLLAGLRIELRCFLEKDREHLRVDVVANVRQGILLNLAARGFGRETRQVGPAATAVTMSREKQLVRVADLCASHPCLPPASALCRTASASATRPLLLLCRLRFCYGLRFRRALHFRC